MIALRAELRPTADPLTPNHSHIKALRKHGKKQKWLVFAYFFDPDELENCDNPALIGVFRKR